jgi:hypothetical protein
MQVIYRKSPFFEFYELELENIYKTKPEFLFEWDCLLLKFIFEKLNFKMEINFTESFSNLITNENDYRNFFSDRKNETKNLSNATQYHQVFEGKIGFQPNMSIVDLLFAEGNNVYNLL